MKHFALIIAATIGCIAPAHAGHEEIRGEERAVVTSAPNVPPPLTRRHATKVLLDVEVKEHTKLLADGVSYTYWTFGDDAPGPVHSRARRRSGRDAVQQSSRQHGRAQHRLSRRHRARRRWRGFVRRARPQRHVHLAGHARRSLSLSLRRGAGGHAPRQRHVRPDPGRAEAGHAQGRQGILHRAGRVLHHRRLRRAAASSSSTWPRRCASSPSTWCSTVAWAHSWARTRCA